MYYIGVDLGTSAVKLLLMEESGKICNIVSKEYPLFFPHPGWSEQNPEDWFTQSVEGMKELTEGIDRSQVAGIGFGGQMHGLVTLDKDDNVIRPAILWNDGRSQKETEYLNNEIGKDKLSQYTANIAFAGFTAPKILWMKKNEPEKFAKIAKIMLPKDYLAYRLSGSFCTDVSDASGMLLLDVKNRCWSKEMMEICDVKEEQLPKLYESWEVVGTLKPEVAKELGFSADVKVVAGAGDNAAAAVGTGTVGDGQCNISLGTSGTIFISSKNFGVDENNDLFDRTAIFTVTLENINQDVRFFRVVYLIDNLLNRIGRGVFASHFDQNGIAQEVAGKLLNLGREGCREHQVLTLFRQQIQYARNVGQKPHVKHTVGLVENHDFDLGKIH